MSILRTRTVQRYYAFIVQPIGEFSPTNWQQTPEHYRVIRQIEMPNRRGKVDAWRFIENQKALADQTASNHWAISIS